MNKSDLISNVAQETGLSQSSVKEVLNSVLSNIAKGTNEEGKVSLLGFGNFSKAVRGARTGRNPQTGEIIQIPEKNVIKFKAQF